MSKRSKKQIGLVLGKDQGIESKMPPGPGCLKIIASSNSPAILSLPHYLVTIRALSFENSINRKEIYSHLLTQSQAIFGELAKNLCIDFISFPSWPSKNNVYAVAIKKIELNHYLLKFKKSFPHIKVVDIDFLSLMRVIPYLLTEVKNKKIFIHITDKTFYCYLTENKKIINFYLQKSEKTPTFHEGAQFFLQLLNRNPYQGAQGITIMDPNLLKTDWVQDLKRELGIEIECAKLVLSAEHKKIDLIGLGAALWK